MNFPLAPFFALLCVLSSRALAAPPPTELASGGKALLPMAGFYTLLDGTKRRALSDDLVGRLYRLLDEASGLSRDETILSRLNDLTLSTRYVEVHRCPQAGAYLERFIVEGDAALAWASLPPLRIARSELF